MFEQAEVFIKTIVSPKPAVRKILTGKLGFTKKMVALS
jgi:hypothetical protein